MKKKKHKNKILLYAFIVFAIILIYIQGHTSYITNIKGFDVITYFDDLCLSIKSNPFNIFHFNKNVFLIFISFYVFVVIYVLAGKKPSADEKWKDIEHGSSHFNTKEESDDFIDEKTDPTMPLFDDEIENIYKICNMK